MAVQLGLGGKIIKRVPLPLVIYITVFLCSIQIVRHSARLGIFKSTNVNSQHIHDTILLQRNKEDKHISCCMQHKMGGDNSKTFRISFSFKMNIFFVVIITHNTRKSLENHISLLYKIFIIKHSYLHIILEILKKFFALKKRIINS